SLGVAVGSLLAATNGYAQMPSARLAVTVSPNTVAAGSEAIVKMRRLDSSGKPALPSSEFTVTLTLTTLDKLEVAKKKLAEGNFKPTHLAAPLNQQTAALPQDKESIQYTCSYPIGQKEIQLKVKSGRAGRLSIFAESRGVFPGSTLLVVLKSSKSAPAKTINPGGSATLSRAAAESDGLILAAHLIPAAWSSSSPPASGVVRGYQLYLKPSGVCAYPEGKERVSEFFVILRKAGTEEEVAAPREIQVN